MLLPYYGYSSWSPPLDCQISSGIELVSQETGGIQYWRNRRTERPADLR